MLLIVGTVRLPPGRIEAALDRHFAAPHLVEWRAAWPALGIGERDLRVYEVGAPRVT